MRQLRFRAWDTQNNKMINPFIVLHSRGLSNYSEYDSFYELMQYTGLKDINGTPIYEGDIVCEETYEDKWGDTHYGYFQVKWDEECAAWWFDDKDHCNDFGAGDYCGGIVVGNIYENPELLDAKE